MVDLLSGSRGGSYGIPRRRRRLRQVIPFTRKGEEGDWMGFVGKNGKAIVLVPGRAAKRKVVDDLHETKTDGGGPGLQLSARHC